MTTAYMLRASGFGREYSGKLVMVLFTWALIGLDLYENNNKKQQQQPSLADRQYSKQNKRSEIPTSTTSAAVVPNTSELLHVFLVGTLWWTILEALISVLGTRDITAGTLWGKTIPTWLSSLLRGSAEGGCIATNALFLADRMMIITTTTAGRYYYYYSWFWRLFFGFSMAFFWWAQYHNQEPEKHIGSTTVASRRDMFTPLAIVYGAVITTSVILYARYLKQYHYKAFRRQRQAFGVMIVFATVWSIAQYRYNLRWIEVDHHSAVSTSSKQWERASLSVELACFAYDIVIEIGVFYVPFYAIPWFYGGLRDEHQCYHSTSTRKEKERTS